MKTPEEIKQEGQVVNKYHDGKTCMMCRKQKENDGHTCCEECAGVPF